MLIATSSLLALYCCRCDAEIKIKEKSDHRVYLFEDRHLCDKCREAVIYDREDDDIRAGQFMLALREM